MLRETDKQYMIRRIKAGECPRYLYKYRALHDNAAEPQLLPNTASILAKAALWHPSPRTFNDPFDCRLSLDTSLSDRVVRSFAKLLAPPNEVGRAQRRSMYKEMRKDTKGTVAKAQQLVWDSMNGIGVCCYGTDGANLLMWSHYADSHQGICLKFDLLVDPEAYIDMIQVSYSYEYPSIAALDFDSMTKFLSVKSDVWAYEREWRVYTRTGPGSKSFRKQGLVEVTLGAQAAAGPADALAELLDADPEYSHVLLRQARLSNRTFSLEFDNY